MTIEQFFTDLLNLSSENTSLIRILILILIFILINISLNRIPQFKNNRGINIIISIVIALLAIAYIKDETISKYILVPYSAFGLILIIGLPFLLILLLTHKSKMLPTARKAIWAVFGIIFLYLWYKNYSSFDKEQNRTMIITLILIATMIWGDKHVHKIFEKSLK